MAIPVADVQFWVFGEPKSSDDTNQMWVFGEPYGILGGEEAVVEKKHTFRLDPKPRTRMSFHPNLKLG